MKKDSLAFYSCSRTPAKEGVPETVIPRISQETLADMIGTTGSRVSFFMNRFRDLCRHGEKDCKFIVRC